MRVLFSEGVVREVSSAEAKPIEAGGGKIVGTEIDFILSPSGDKLQFVYEDNISVEMKSRTTSSAGGLPLALRGQCYFSA